MAKCEKCGKALKRGDLAYKVRIEILSLYDGYVEEPGQDIDEHLERLVEAVARQDPDQVMKDVAQSIAITICRACRNDLVKSYDPKEARVIH